MGSARWEKKMGHLSTYSSSGDKSMLYLQGNMTG